MADDGCIHTPKLDGIRSISTLYPQGLVLGAADLIEPPGHPSQL